MAHNVKVEEISKCTRKSVNALRNARRSFRSKAQCECRVQGDRNKEICKNLQGLCNELQGSPDCLIYFGEGAINRLSDVQTIALKIAQDQAPDPEAFFT